MYLFVCLFFGFLSGWILMWKRIWIMLFFFVWQTTHWLVGAHIPDREAEKNSDAEQKGAGHNPERHPQSRTTRADRAAPNRVEISAIFLCERPFLILLTLYFYSYIVLTWTMCVVTWKVVLLVKVMTFLVCADGVLWPILAFEWLHIMHASILASFASTLLLCVCVRAYGLYV